MESLKKELVESILDSQGKMVEQLHHWCEINTGTENLQGLNHFSNYLQRAYQPLADSIQTKILKPVLRLDMAGNEELQHFGDLLFISKRPELKRRVLLSGHMDTVYGPDHPFQHIQVLSDNKMNGPGVADMKGGLMVMLHALAAFERSSKAATLGWDVLINADEEAGSPASSLLFPELAGGHQAALVFEPAITSTGTLARNRRGSGKFTVIAKGRRAHVGRAFSEGRNAICYLAEVLLAIHDLNNNDMGITVNVGRIAGGEALNIVPDKAVAKLDVRITLAKEEDWVKQKFEHIIRQFELPGYSLSFHGSFGRPVKRISYKTERLFQRLQGVGKLLGLKIDWEDSGGSCDGNNFSKLNIPVLDSLGVRGGHIHTEEEFILADSLSERACLTALLMLDLAEGGLEDLNS